MNKQYLILGLFFATFFCACKKKSETSNLGDVKLLDMKRPPSMTIPENPNPAERWFETLLWNGADINRVNDIGLLRFSIRNLNDSLFYLYPDTILEARIIAMVDFDVHPNRIQSKELLDTAVSEFRKKLLDIPSPLIEDQIWDEEFMLAINQVHPKTYDLKADVPIHYVHEIEELNIRGPYLNGFNDTLRRLLNEFENVDNDRISANLLFKLLIRTVELNKDHGIDVYVRSVADSLENKCNQSIELTNREKAKWLIGCSKLLGYHYPMEYFHMSFLWLKLAQGYCELLPEDYLYLDKVKTILYKNAFSSQNFSYGNLSETIDNYWEYSYVDSVIYTPEALENLLTATRQVLEAFKNNFQKTGILGDKKFLDIASRLFVLNTHFRNGYGKENEKLRYDYLLLLSDYHRLRLNLDTALLCLYKAMEIQLQSTDVNFQMSFQETTHRIELLLKDMGQPPFTMHGFKGLRSFTSYEFQIPRDSRLWTRSHIDTLKLYLKHLDIAGSSFTGSFINYSFHVLLDQGIKDVLRKIGMYEARRNNGNEACYFLSKADSVIVSAPNMTASIAEGGGRSIELASKYFLEKEVKERERRFYLILCVAIGIFLIALYAWYQRRNAIRAEEKAEEAKAKANVLTHTLDQVGHMAPKCINNVIDTTVPEMDKQAYSKIRSVSDLLRAFHDFSLSDINLTCEQEFNLACHYIDLAYSLENTKASNFISCNWQEFSEIEFPKYVLFNTVQNAFKHGIPRRPVEVFLNKIKEKLEVVVKNEFKNSSGLTTDTIQEGSGTKYIRAVLSHWNQGIEYKFNYKVDANTFTTIFDFKIH